MTDIRSSGSQARNQPRLLNGWRIAGWGAALALILLPALAMRFDIDVNWTNADFVVAAVLLTSLGAGIELATRIARGRAHRGGIILVAVLCFLTFWINGAVGIIGSEDELVNLGFYALVLAVALTSLGCWFRPRIMVWIAGLAAAALPALGIAALSMMPGHAVEWGLLAGMATGWAGAALLFRKAAAA